MKILLINGVCGIRSTGRICTDLATALEEQGHEVRIAYGRETVPEEFNRFAVKIGSDFDVKLHALKARLFDGCGWGSIRATKRFIKWVKEYNPDIIHIHNIHGYYINIEVLFDYLRTCGKRIIWTLHDCWAFTGHSAYCDAANCERWIYGCYDCPNMREYPASFVDKSSENWERKKRLLSDIPNLTIVTPSEWLAGLVKKSFLSQYPVTVIHNGIDTSQFYPMKNDFREFYNIESKYILLGVATVWNEMKGFSDYIKLADMLDDDYLIVMVGLTKEQIKHLPSNILGIERTNSIKELASIYSSADLYLNLSYCENYPTVNLEAIACGTPVITYDTGGSGESAVDGVVIDRGDLSAVKEAVINIRKKDTKGINVNIQSIDTSNTIDKYIKICGGGYWNLKYQLGLIHKRIAIGVAAVWDNRKGLKDVVKLSELTDNTAIIVVGVSEEQIENLPNNIIAYRRTNSVEELRQLYSIADYFVNPTYEDNYPTTNLEAIACGTPVVTYRTGGSGESANIFGDIVDKGDVVAMAACISIEKSRMFDSIDNKIIMKEEAVKDYLDLYE